MSRQTYLTAPLHDTDAAHHAVRVAQATNSAIAGKLNAVADLTLAINATSTIFIDARLSAFSFLGFMPTTAHAATALAGIYVDTMKTGSAVIHHASSANADQSFSVLIIG